jgi:hypothetical protein
VAKRKPQNDMSEQEQSQKQKREKNTIKDYFGLGEIVQYFFRGKTGKRPSFNIRMMHGINKISILVFLLAIIIWVIRRVA